MRKLLLILLTAAIAAPVFAQDKGRIEFSGEVKTGVYWRESHQEGLTKTGKVGLHSMDDAGGEGNQGRFRLNIDYFAPERDDGNQFGASVRFETQEFGNEFMPFKYAYGWGEFFEKQLKISIGRLGGSPWGSGGPEKWTELENGTFGGMRVEYKPGWIPENIAKQVNIGFVLSYFNDSSEDPKEPTIGQILQESVFGISWKHDYFMARAAVRLDSDYDRARAGDTNKGEGIKMVYRVEEYALRTVAEGLSAYALGVLIGVGAEDTECVDLTNWLFVRYEPKWFTAELRLGYDVIHNRTFFHAKPTFDWYPFELADNAERPRLLQVSASYWWGQDFGDGKVYKGSPYSFMEVEPKIQLNFASSYIAFVYNLRWEYKGDPEAIAAAARTGKDPIEQKQRINLRFCIYY